MTLHSDPIVLGTATATASGTLTITGTIPFSTPAGAHTITIALASDPNAVLASIPLTVVAAAATTAATSGNLAATGGSDWQPWAYGAGILLALGAALMIWRRRSAA
jgi:LPXTG-motif cell wall-anchored protein